MSYTQTNLIWQVLDGASTNAEGDANNNGVISHWDWFINVMEDLEDNKGEHNFDHHDVLDLMRKVEPNIKLVPNPLFEDGYDWCVRRFTAKWSSK